MRIVGIQILITVAAILVQGCSSHSAREYNVYDFISSCDGEAWELCRRKQNSLKKASIQSFQKQLDRAFETAYPHSDLHSRTNKKDFELLIVRDPHSAFLFQSTLSNINGRSRHVIKTSSETIVTLGKLTMAGHLSRLPGFNDEWLARYMMYVRGTPDGQPIVDPLRASGLLSVDQGKVSVPPGAPDFRDIFRLSMHENYQFLTYLVAHELYHLDRPFECLESDSVCRVLKQKDETAADQFATALFIKLWQDMTEEHINIALPAHIMSQLMAVMEGRAARSPIIGQSHPPLHERYRSTVLTLKAWFDRNYHSNEAAPLRELIEMHLETLSDIDEESPEGYFDDLDSEAEGVTLASLKIF